MTQMRTQTRGETLCDLVCGWLMDKTDVCSLGGVWGRDAARRRSTRPACHMPQQRPPGPGRARPTPNSVQM